MNRNEVACPRCELTFTSSRQQTYCPGCKALIEPKVLVPA